MNGDTLRARLRLYVVTEDAGPGRSHLDVVRAAVAGGATAVQLRAKDLPDSELAALAREAAALCRRAGVLFLVNDRVEVARLAGADGVHLGQDDAPPAAARALLGREAVVGVSCATAAEARAAAAAGADYLGVGSIYATATKPDAGEPIGLAGLRRVRAAVALPLVAIGGITPANAAAVVRAGADGVAVVGAVTRAPDMEAAVRTLRALLDAVPTGGSGQPSAPGGPPSSPSV